MSTTHNVEPCIPDHFGLSGIVQLWILRMLVLLGGYRRFVKPEGWGDDELAEALGLKDWDQVEKVDYERDLIVKRLRNMYADIQCDAPQYRLPAILEQNIGCLASLVELSHAEQQLLAFVVLLETEPFLENASEFLPPINGRRISHVLATILSLPQSDISDALSLKSRLRKAGLVTLDRRVSTGSLAFMLDLPSSSFAMQMLVENPDPTSFLKDSVIGTAPSMLELRHFSHLSDSLQILLPYLRKAVASHRTGVNVLLYGDPGTGKSELTRLLASNCDVRLYETASEDGDGDPVQGSRRLQALRAAQNLFAGRKAMLLFDEAEDVFRDRLGAGEQATAQTRKGWLNRMLEENSVPTIWVSNSIDTIDPAFIRRFDLVVEVPVPPMQQRKRIIQQQCHQLIDEAVVTRLASVEVLSPAVISRSSHIVNEIKEELSAEQASRALVSLVDETLLAQGHPSIKSFETGVLPSHYSPAYINTDTDLSAVAEGLIDTIAGRLCLYGPPGTGKSAFGRWLAKRLDLPVHLKRASDLISPWIGETERRIERAFRTAEREGAVLLIDEIDSFLQDRRGAQRSWEVTGVNEMLTQMEAFEGLFIATTNLMDGLDQAALRRFDLKLHFDYLTPIQAWDLFQATCREMDMEMPENTQKQYLSRLKVLTPGDFSAVLRRSRFNPIRDTNSLLEALVIECSLKEDGKKRPIGFV